MRSSAEASYGRVTAGLVIALLLALLAAVGYPLLHVPAQGYAATPTVTPAVVTTADYKVIIHAEHRLIARHNRTTLAKWHHQVVLDAERRAAKIAAQKAATPPATVLSVSSSAFAPVGYGEPDSVPGVPAGSYAACVAWRESGDVATYATGLFGFLTSTWSWMASAGGPAAGYGDAGDAPISVQIQAFAWEYARYGHSAWPDGC